MNAVELIRTWAYPWVNPCAPWEYLWTEALDQTLSGILDKLHGYPVGSALWPLDAVFSGGPLFRVTAFRGERLFPPPPVLEVRPYGGRTAPERYEESEVKRGLSLKVIPRLYNPFWDAWAELSYPALQVCVADYKRATLRAAAHRRSLQPEPVVFA